MDNTLQRLQDWYISNCNEDWEHTYGIQIENCDNPGWLVTIDLEATYLQEIEFAPVQTQKVDENGWIQCRKENHKFKAAGGPEKLNELLEIFLTWVEENEPK